MMLLVAASFQVGANAGVCPAGRFWEEEGLFKQGRLDWGRFPTHLIM